MSERRSGSEPADDDPGGGEPAEELASQEFPAPPAAARPITPYDPYRSPGIGRRNVAAEGFELERRPRGADRGPFLPDDDPLNAEAWQLEFGEVGAADQAFETAPGDELREDPAAPFRTRRQRATPRPSRAGGGPSGRAPRRGRTESPARDRQAVTLAIPRAVSGASLVSDQTMLTLLGINIAGIVVMAVVLGVRSGGLPPAMVLRLDAAGNPALWGSSSVLWRLPIMSLFTTVMFLAFAWVFHPIDRFAARFALAAAVVAQAIAWVAVVLHLS